MSVGALESEPRPLSGQALGGARAARAGDYFALLKPRVMSLVIFTAFVGAYLAPQQISPALAAIAILAIALGAGSAGALNMWWDADIDAKMSRTKTRPVPAGRIPAAEALTFGLVGSGLSVLLMALTGAYLAAGMLAFSIFFYAVVYTMWLKRRTAQNIVIGGLAGAFPPAIGWAAASGEAPLAAFSLVALIFFWTPPHFWALSLVASKDYAAAGVPMLPNVAGARTTRRHVLGYAILLVPFALAPAAFGLGGIAYLAIAGAGGALFVALAWRLAHLGAAADDLDRDNLVSQKAAKAARGVFAYSIFYLFVLFAALFVETLLQRLGGPA